MASDEPPQPSYATPNGCACPRTVRVDGTVEGSGDCLGCGVCMLFAGLLDREAQVWSAPSSTAWGTVRSIFDSCW